MMRRARIWLLSLVLACGSAACGSDDDGNGTGGSAGSSGAGGSGGGTGGSSGSSGGSAGTGGSAGAGASGGSAGSSGVGGSAGVAGTGGQSAYPPGPYGKEVGSVVANYAFQGYVNDTGDALSTTKPSVATYTMDDLRKSGKAYAFLHVAQFF
jgi:hypothetical protein